MVNFTGLDEKLASKANANHTHDERYYTEAEIENKLKSKANLQGPAMTGSPTINGKSIVVAVSPTEYTLPISTGFVIYEGGKYYKTQDGIVIANGRIASAGGAALSSGMHCVAVLPAGYRPKTPVHGVASVFSTTSSEVGAIPCWANAAGKIYIMLPYGLAANTSSAVNYPAFGINCSFVAA